MLRSIKYTKLNDGHTHIPAVPQEVCKYITNLEKALTLSRADNQFMLNQVVTLQESMNTIQDEINTMRTCTDNLESFFHMSDLCDAMTYDEYKELCENAIY